jgi:hypothetical protein
MRVHADDVMTSIIVNRDEDAEHKICIYVDDQKWTVRLTSSGHTFPKAPDGPVTKRVVALDVLGPDDDVMEGIWL